MRGMRKLVLIAGFALFVSCVAESNAPFSLEIAPEFVQGAIPGEHLVLLVTVGDEGDSGEPVDITAGSDEGEVSVEGTSIKAGEVSEVTFVPDPVGGEVEIPFTVVVTGTRGAIEKQAEVSSVVVPWEDTVSETANQILDLFTEWLSENEPDLGITPETVFDGTVVAPQLLVVTHYAFFSNEWEIGLSWHIMVAPDDWAQIYLRPRDQLAPAKAFELDSWSTALSGNPFEISEIPPPAEVTR